MCLCGQLTGEIVMLDSSPSLLRYKRDSDQLRGPWQLSGAPRTPHRAPHRPQEAVEEAKQCSRGAFRQKKDRPSKHRSQA